MTQQTRLTALAQAIGADIKSITAKIGDLTSLTTVDKSSVVAALNELVTNLSNLSTALAGKADSALLNAVITGSGLTAGTGAYAPDATSTYIKLATSLANADKLLDVALKAVADRVSEIEGGGTGVQIDDDAGAGDTGVVWSADKSTSAIAASAVQIKDDILGGAGPAYDTLKELQDLLESQDDAVIALTTAVNNRVSFADAQTLTTAQKLQACQNIGIGDPETDFVSAYNAAKV